MHLEHYFADRGGGMTWEIVLKEYDSTGDLVTLIPCKSAKIKTRWRALDDFLIGCPDGNTREVRFRRNGKVFPSIISDGKRRLFAEPIAAKLPLLEYARKLEFIAA
jgi:hypothetical protein